MNQSLSRQARALGLVFVHLALTTGFGCSPRAQKLLPRKELRLEKVREVGDTKQIVTPKVDILFVVDDSGSMATHQTNLSRNIRLFTDEIQQYKLLDYHVGVVTSSMDSYTTGRSSGGKLVGTPAFVDRTMPNASTALAGNLLVGTNGSATEMFFAPVQAALEPPNGQKENAGFYRDDAFLAVIFITDSDDQSTSLDANSFYQYLVNKKGDKEKILVYAAYIPSTTSGCDRSGEPSPTRIEDLFRLAGGIGFGLCDPDFGKKLTELSVDLVTRVGRTIYLNRPPDVSTIQVRYGTQVIPNDPRVGWTYDPANNALLFGRDIEFTNQPDKTEVEVNFIAAEY